MTDKGKNTCDPNRKWLLEVTEQQMEDIVSCVESIDRFLAGQTDCLDAATRYVDDVTDFHLLQDKLRELKPYMTPGLRSNASYGWNGGHCPNPAQKDAIARMYALYRELRHILTVYRGQNNVYSDTTLTCGYELPKAMPGKLEDVDARNGWHRASSDMRPPLQPVLARLASGNYVIAKYDRKEKEWVSADGITSWMYKDDVEEWIKIPE